MKLDDLQERARQMVTEALESCRPLPADHRDKLVLGIRFEGNDRVFELYVPGERPEDAIVVARATLDEDTGMGTVETFPEEWEHLV